MALVATLVAACAFALPAPPAAQAAVDSTLSLNGTSQYAQVADNSALRLSTNLTIEAWVKPTSTCATFCNVIIREYGYAIAGNNSRWYYRYKSAGSGWTDVDTGVAMVAGEWVHLALTRDSTSGNVTFYVNGVARSTAASPAFDTTAAQVTVGAFQTAVQFFPGQIDDMRLWNVTRSAAQIATDMRTWGPAATTGLVAYWDFNDVSGSTAANRSTATAAASGTDLTLTGSPSTVDVKTTSASGGRTVVTFPRSYLTSDGGWTAPTGVTSVDYLVVGGGGGGGAWVGGGGGGGGVLQGTKPVTSAANQVTVGMGGFGTLWGTANAANAARPGSSGQSSVFADVTGSGGGRGGSYSDSTSSPESGGSGGGTGSSSGAGSGTGSGTTRQGYDGNVGVAADPFPAGGGGGAGGGGIAASSSAAGAGGAGRPSSITGASVRYGGGGGGGIHSATGTVGSGTDGGGSGLRNTTTKAGNGTAGRGGGGGGGGNPNNLVSEGGNGGSGAVILSYADPGPVTIPTDASRDFNGTTDSVIVPDQSAVDLSDSFTIEAWVRPVSSGNYTILRKQNSYTIGILNGVLQYALNQSGTSWSWTSTGVSITSSTWTHVAFAKNGTALSVYINGSSTASYSATVVGTLLNTASPLVVGADGLTCTASPCDTGMTFYFTGQMDNLRIWSTARTGAQIAAAYDKRFASDLLAFLFDEPSGLVAYNSARTGGSALNGTYTGTASSATIPTLSSSTTFAVTDTGTYSGFLPGYDPIGDVTYAVGSQGVKGTVAITAATGAFTYTPTTNSAGLDAFTYTATRGSTTSSEQSIGASITDTTAPTVSSFTSAVSSPTNAASIAYTLTFSESVTGVAAGDFSNTGTATGCVFAPGTDSGASRTVTLTSCSAGTIIPRFAALGAVDGASTAGPASAATSTSTIARDVTAPTVSSFSSTTVDGVYKSGAAINVTATTSESIQSGNTLTVTLDTGATVLLTAGSAGTTLTGIYTVEASQTSADLTVSSFSIGTVADTAGNAMSSTTVPSGANNIAGSKAIVVDTTAPTVASFSSTTLDGVYKTGAAISVTATTSEAIQSGNALTVRLDTGEAVVLTAPSAGTTLTGTYTVGAGQTSADLTVSSFSIGTVADTAGNVMSSTMVPSGVDNIAGSKAIVVDTTAPSVSSFVAVTSSPTNALSLSFTLTFTEAVMGVAAIDFSNTGTATGCVFAPGTDSGASRTVTLTGCSAGTIIPRFAALGASDAAGNAGPAAAADGSTITRDVTAPMVSSFSSTTADGAYKSGAAINVTATTSESIQSGNTLTVTLDTGATVLLTAGSVGTTLTGSYSVAATQNSADLTVSSFSIGTVADTAGNAMSSTTVPSGANNIAGSKAIVVDTTAPTVSSFSSTTADGAYKLGATINVTATTGESIQSGNTLTVTLDTGEAVVLTAGSAGTTLTGTYTVGASQTSADLTVSSFSIGTVADTAGNAMSSTTVPTGANNIAGSKAIVVDTTAPSVASFTTAQGSPTNAASVAYTLTFSEAVTGAAAIDFSNTGTATDCVFAPGTDSGTSRTVTISSCSEGTVIPEFAVGGAADAAGNAGPAAASTSGTTITIDRTAPTATLVAVTATPTNASSIVFTLTFSEAVTGVAAGDFTQTGTATGCVFAPGADAGAIRTVTLTNCSAGTTIPHFAANGATDTAGNTGPVTIVNGPTITRDTAAPTVSSFVAVTATPTKTAALSYTLTFSRAVTGIAAGDLRNVGTAASCVFDPGTDTGAIRTIAITGCGEGTIIPRFAAGGATDVVGNTGPASAADGDTIVRDITAPAVASFTAVTATPTNATTLTYTFTFSESVTGVAAGDFTQTGTAAGCSFSPGADTSASRTVTVTGCGEGTVIPRFAAAAADDLAANSGPASAATGATIMRDVSAPIVTGFSSVQASPTNATVLSYSLTFSESVIGVTAADLSNAGTAASCAFDPGTDAGASRTITITGCTAGTVVPEFAAGGAADPATNSGPVAAATATTTITIDRTAPTASLTAVTSSPTNATALSYTLTFSEAVTGVAAVDLANTGTATGCAFDPGSDAGASRTVTITGCSEGTLIPRFATDGATDAAGNTGPDTAATGSSIAIDRTAPSVSGLASVQATPTTSASLAFTLTFSESVTGVAAADLSNTGTATGCAFDPGADVGASRTVTITGCSEGTVTPQFAARGAVDAAANAGPAAAATATSTITRDVTAPSVVSLAAVTASPTNLTTLTFTLTFSEPVTGVAAADFSNTGTATACAFAPGADTDATRTLTVTGCSDGTVIPRFAAGGASDGAGTTGPAAAFDGATIVRDGVPPTVASFAPTTPTLTNAATVVYALTFSKNVTGVGAGDFANLGTAVGCAFNPGTDSGSMRTVTVTGCTDGTVTPRFAANGATDGANTGPATAADGTTVTRDTVAPTLAAIGVSGTEDTLLTFAQAAFAAAYADLRTSTPTGVSVVGLPHKGTLRLSGTPVTAGQVIAYADLGSLTYTPAANANGAIAFTVAASDGINTSSPATTVTMTLAAVNDAPELGTPTTAAYTDTTANDTFADATGALAGTDVDTGTTLLYGIQGVTPATTVVRTGTFGTLSITRANGAYVFAPNRAAINARTTDTTETFTVTVTDGSASATAVFTVSITAADDTPTLAAPTTIAYTDTTSADTFASVTGTLVGADRDAGAVLAYSIASGASASASVGGVTYDRVRIGTYGTLRVASSTGAYLFVPDMTAINAVAVDTTEAHTVRVGDGTATTDAVLTIAITGVNDRPILTAPAGGTVTDTADPDAFANVAGTLSAADAEGTTPVYGIQGVTPSSGSASLRGAYGTLTVASGGGWTYVADEAKVNALAANASDAFAVTASDGSLVDIATLTIAIIGANDAPVMPVPTGAMVVDTAGTDSFTPIDGAVAASDAEGTPRTYGIDNGTTTVSSLAGTYGALAIDASSGLWTYTPNATAINARSANTSDEFTVTASDGALIGNATLTIAITGVNDTPILGSPAGGVVRDNDSVGPPPELAASLSAADAEGGALLYGIVSGSGTVTSHVGAFGTLVVVAATGAWTYTPDDAAVRALSGLATDSFTVNVSDGTATVTQTMTLSLMGINNRPVLSAPVGGSLTDTSGEDAYPTPLTGNLVSSDPDFSTIEYGIDGVTPVLGLSTGTGNYGTLVVNRTTGTWAYTPSAAAVNALANDATDTFTVTAGDGALTAQRVLAIAISATNDRPLLSAVPGPSYTDGAATDAFANTTGVLASTDAEGTARTYDAIGSSASTQLIGGVSYTRVVVGAYGTLRLLPATGQYVYLPNDAAINALANSVTDVFTVSASDGSLGSSRMLVVSIAAADDAPTLAAPLPLALADTPAADAFPVESGVLSGEDAESAPLTYDLVPNVASSASRTDGGFTSTGNAAIVSVVGTYGTLALRKSNGAYTYTPSDAAINALSGSDTDSFTVRVSDGVQSADRTLAVAITGTRELPIVTWAEPASIAYGTALSGTQLNATATGFAGPVGGSITYAEGVTSRVAGDVLAVGTHTLVATFTPTDAATYSTATDTASVVVERADQTVIAQAASVDLTYGGTGTTLSAAYVGPHGAGAVTYAVDSGPCAVSGANLTVTGAGTCQVTAAIAQDASYNAATSAPIAITVAKATLTVTAQSAQKRVTTSDPSLTYLMTGYVGADGPSSIDVSDLTTLREVGELVGTYAIGFTGAVVAADYEVDYVGGIFTIIDKDVPTITWPEPMAITYGTALSATQLNAVAAYGGNPLPGVFAYSIGTTPIASGTVLPAGSRVLTATFTPADTATYASGATAQVALAVDRKPLAVTGVAAVDKVFDGSAVAALDLAGATLVGIVGSDAVELDTSAAVGALASPDVGVGRAVAVSGLALAGADRGQYTIVQPAASATVTATVPGLPSSVSATAGDARATVEWSAPAFSGGLPIIGYTVTASPGGRTCTWTTGPLACTIAELANGTPYTFTVRAVNAVGPGSASSASPAVTPAAPPVPPAAAPPAALDDTATVSPDGSAVVQVGCAATARACSATVKMFIGSAQIATRQEQIAAGQTQNVALALPLKLQRRLAAEGVLSVRVVTVIDIDGSQVRVQLTLELTAPAAQAVRSASLKAGADGSAVITGQCTGTAVSRCDGTITLYGDPALLDARLARASERVVVGTARFAGASGTAVRAKTTLSAAGRKLLVRRGALRVTPVMTFTGGTKLDNELAGFTLSMLNTEQWLRRALATLYIGGQPRMDLNILLDRAKRRVVPWNVAARQIEGTIIPQRERARQRVAALPTPPPALRPITTLLLRAFNQSLQANHAYVKWLRSGRAEDTKGWRMSLRASATKAELLRQLTAAGGPYGIRVPSATNFWP